MARILIVEDSADSMKLFRALLTLNGHVVHGVPSGDGLASVIGEHLPELILLDIQLPGRDGFSLLPEIRASGHGQRPVVALTAHASASDRQTALEAGFDGYLTKPIDVSRFPALVERFARGERVEE